MVELGQRRIMRNGTVVTVGPTIWKHDPYWERLQRHRPFVQLMLPTGQIFTRTYGTVTSYPLEDNYRRQHG